MSLSRARSALTIVALLALFLAGLSYLLIAVARINPFASPIRVTVNLAHSGGLLDTSNVSYRGYPVGRVDHIEPRAGGVRVTVLLDSDARIPVDTEVVVANLSAAGEQYLDFRPRTDRGPFLTDGAVIEQPDTRLPVPFARVVANMARLVEQVDPEQAAVVVDELARAFNGSAPDIQRVLDGGAFLLAGLEEVLPETVRLLGKGRIVLGTVADLRGELVEFGEAARGLTGTLREADPTIHELVDVAPGALALLGQVVREDGPSVAALLGDLGTTTQVLAMRRPALSALLPEMAQLGPNLALIVRDNKAHVLVDAFPRPSCDYGTPRRPPTIGGSPPPRLYRYCTESGPRLQQRGSVNVPRPPGDDTAGPPPGADPEQHARAPREAPGG